MREKKIRNVRVSLLFFILFFSIKYSYAQYFFIENKEIFSNYNLFSDTITLKDTIVFINNINSGKFPCLREDTISIFKKTYYNWSFSSSGASIGFNYYENPYWRGSVEYYPFKVTQENIFGKVVLIFYYQNKFYFFEIIEERMAPNNDGSLIALVKL